MTPSEKDKNKKWCHRCNKMVTPIRKLHCYICSVCFVVLREEV